jgi:Domain of unknown function (DUF4129)
MDLRQKSKYLLLPIVIRRISLVLSLAFLFLFISETNAQKKEIWTQEEINEARKDVEFEGSPKKKVKQTDKQMVNDGNKKGEPTPLEDPPSPFWTSVQNFFSSTAGKIITFTLILSLLITTIYIFIQKNKRVNDFKVVSLSEDDLQQLEDNLVETDIDKFLRSALDGKNYKLAIRLLYLRALQNLHDSDLINWKKEKTNRDYLSEMRNHKSYNDLRELTLAFDIVWYGDHEVSESTFNQLQPAFKSFNESISGKK